MRYFCQNPYCYECVDSSTQKYCTLCLLKKEPSNAQRSLEELPQIKRNWKTRNDSSNVADILAGKWYPKISKPTSFATSKESPPSVQFGKVNLKDYKCDCACIGCNPALSARAKKTKPLTVKCNKFRMKSSNFRKFRHSAQKRVVPSAGSSVCDDSRKFECNLNCYPATDPKAYKQNVVDHLDFTNRRQNLERAYVAQPSVRARTRCDCDSDRTFARTSRDMSNECADPRDAPSTCEIKDLSDFRNSNYEETHASKTISDAIKIPIHTCIHPHELNDRLFATPVETESPRCVICDLPLVTGLDFVKNPGTGIQNFEWEYIKKREIVRKRMENYVPQEVTLKIPVCPRDRNHTVIPQSYGKYKDLQRNACGQFRLYLPRVEKVCPRDSLALRFQKGMHN